MAKTGIIILCHGSRGDRAVTELPSIMQSIAAGVKSLINSEVDVTWGALQFNSPTLEEAAAALISGGVTSVIVVPYFVFSGRHIEEDIPEEIDELSKRYPEVKFTMTGTIGEDILLFQQVVKRIRETVPELWLDIPYAQNPPETIEQRSMDIIETLLPAGLHVSAEEKAVIKRIVHASGDPELVRSIFFSPEAIISGIDAIRNNSPIYTDVRMVAAGISSRYAKACGCPILCALDETAGTGTTSGSSTRTAAAIKSLGQKLNGSIVSIGNAPTALLALVDSIDKDTITPALVVGMPVGFVQAAESKEALITRGVPFITVRGTRGGSAMATATVNALLKIVTNKN